MRKAAVVGLFFLMGALVPSLPALGAPPATAGLHYQSGKTYSGIFETGRLYNRFPQTPWKGSLKPAFLKEVICYRAHFALARYGTWTGVLRRDGSCSGFGEPHIWATGNYLNALMSAGRKGSGAAESAR